MYNLGINLFFSSFRHTVILNKPHFKLQNIRLCCQLLVVRLESGVSLEGEGGGGFLQDLGKRSGYLMIIRWWPISWFVDQRRYKKNESVREF